jgi:hypothetical protein
VRQGSASLYKNNTRTNIVMVPSGILPGLAILTFYRLLPVVLLLGVVACVSTSMRWEKPGTDDAAGNEAECRATAHKRAADLLPYGDGPPLYGLTSDVSMLQWKMAIDNQRSYLAGDLTKSCMRSKGFALVPASGQQ